MKCPVCLSHNLQPFLSRKSVPVHQNLVIQTKAAAIETKKGDLLLQHCLECDFVHNAAFDPQLLSYGQAYDNTQENSPSFHRHITQLSQYLIEEKGVKNCCIVEVGCGKGGFLKLLTKDIQFQNLGIGFDPTYVGEESMHDGRLQFKKCFYDERTKDLEVDVVICRHVIEHIPNPVEFLKLIRKTLIHSPKARLFFETPCLKWILENRVIWDFFYEHCSYFTQQSLQVTFEMAGFEVSDVTHVFEGQYLWLEATLGAEKDIKSTSQIENLIKEYAGCERAITESLKSRLFHDGKVALWGAGAKGVTFANLIDEKRNLIDCVIDINPNKQNHFIPGTGHPIVSYVQAAQRGVKKAMIMNNNYKEESRELLVKEGLAIELF